MIIGLRVGELAASRSSEVKVLKAEVKTRRGQFQITIRYFAFSNWKVHLVVADSFALAGGHLSSCSQWNIHGV
jgi:hypothetical protein